MPSLTSDGHAATPRGGITGVALELLSSGARGAVKAPLTLLKLPLLGCQQAWWVTSAVRRGSSGLAGRGLQLVGLRNGSDPDGAVADPAGYLTEPESLNGEYAEFSPDFAVGLDASAALDADADLIAELGTDFSASLTSDDRDVTISTVTTADLTAADLAAADRAAADLVGTELSAEDREAAMADLASADLAEAAGPAATAAEDDSGPAADIVTRAAVAAEEAAADENLPQIDRDELPIADFDHVTAGSLRGRLRRLELPELRTLRTYEQEHGHRLPILTLLENRIAKLEAGSPA